VFKSTWKGPLQSRVKANQRIIRSRSIVVLITQWKSEPKSAAIVKALMALGRGLGLTVTAEGIETRGELDALMIEGCEEGQGFLFSKAVRGSETWRFFKDEVSPKPLSVGNAA